MQFFLWPARSRSLRGSSHWKETERHQCISFLLQFRLLFSWSFFWVTVFFPAAGRGCLQCREYSAICKDFNHISPFVNDAVAVVETYFTGPDRFYLYPAIPSLLHILHQWSIRGRRIGSVYQFLAHYLNCTDQIFRIGIEYCGKGFYPFFLKERSCLNEDLRSKLSKAIGQAWCWLLAGRRF